MPLLFAATVGILGLAGCLNDTRNHQMGLATQTELDCTATSDNGKKVQICHNTEGTNDFVLIDISTKACAAAHANDPKDKNPSADGTCDEAPPTAGFCLSEVPAPCQLASK